MTPATKSSSRPLAATLALCFTLGLGACGDGAEEPATTAEPTRLESAEVGIAVEVPAGSSFTAQGTDGGVLRLASPGETTESGVALGPATLVYDAEPPQVAGVNLVEAVNQRKEELEGRPNGRFYGQVELGGPLGTAYSTRGSYGEGGEDVEEVRIFAVHPQGDRLLHVTLQYAPVQGQGPARVDQALRAFGWIEPLEEAGAVAGEELGTAGGGLGTAVEGGTEMEGGTEGEGTV